MVIPDVKPADAGVYKCVASNKFGETSCEATVTVTGKERRKVTLGVRILSMEVTLQFRSHRLSFL